MIPAKMASLGLYKRKVFWNKVYDVAFFVHESNYTVDVFMWPKFGNSSISMR